MNGQYIIQQQPGVDLKKLAKQFADECFIYCSGVMGVPITFLDKYCPEQFEILDINPHFFVLVEAGFEKPKQLSLHHVGKKDPYARILVRRKRDA